MKYIAAYMLLGVVVCLFIFCADEVNEMRKYAKKYAEAKSKFDAMVWKEAVSRTRGKDVEFFKVVRCGECRYMMPDGRCSEFADLYVRPSASDFCSYGQRREETANV